MEVRREPSELIDRNRASVSYSRGFDFPSIILAAGNIVLLHTHIHECVICHKYGCNILSPHGTPSAMIGSAVSLAVGTSVSSMKDWAFCSFLKMMKYSETHPKTGKNGPANFWSDSLPLHTMQCCEAEDRKSTTWPWILWCLKIPSFLFTAVVMACKNKPGTHSDWACQL